MVQICQHPLIETKLSLMRDKQTPTAIFRDCLEEITYLMSFYVFEHSELIQKPKHITTPTGATLYPKRLKDKVLFVPVLRAGLGMLTPMLKLIPTAEVGYLAIARDEATLKSIKYYEKIPALDNPQVVILEPMLATGGSLIQTLDTLKEAGFTRFKVVSIIAAPEGIAKIKAKHPDINIYICSLDENLNEHGFIMPGLGDVGDRLYGFSEER